MNDDFVLTEFNLRTITPTKTLLKLYGFWSFRCLNYHCHTVCINLPGMRAAVALCAIWLSFLSFISTAQPLQSVSEAPNRATTLSCTAAPNGGATCVNGDEDDSEASVPFTGIPGTARERSFFVSISYGVSCTKEYAAVVEIITEI